MHHLDKPAETTGVVPTPQAATPGGVDARVLLSLFTVLTLAGFTIGGVFLLRNHAGARFNAGAIGWFVPVLVLLWAALFDEIRRRPYSLHLMHLIGAYVLLATAPLYQVTIGIFPLETFDRPVMRYVALANVAIVLWLTSYLVCYYAFSLLLGQRSDRWRRSRFDVEVSPARIRLALILSFPTFGYLAYLGLAGVVTRLGASEAFSTVDSGPLYLLNKVFVRALPIVALGAGLLLLRRTRVLNAPFTALLVFAVLIGVLLVDNPLAAARYWTVAVVLGFVGPHFLRNRRTGILLLLASIVGLSVLPAIGETRRAATTQELLEDLNLAELPSPVLYLATSGDVAGYGVLNLAFRWIDQHGHTWGRQMAGAALFWFPRSAWPDKPVSTGGRITEDFGFSFTVISAPILTEPLMDFGFLGIPFLAALFAWVLAYLDLAYYSTSDGGRIRVIDTFYPFLLGLILFITRGNMMSAIAFTSGFVASTLPLILSMKFLVGPSRWRGSGSGSDASRYPGSPAAAARN